MSACLYFGLCSNYGCEHFAKAPQPTYVLPLALKLPTCEIRTGADVPRIELAKGKRTATGVT